MSEEFPVDVEDLIVIYNRVPKTASTSFANIAYDLCATNKFHVLHINVTKNYHVLSISDQMRFVQNITAWSAFKPAFYHGHVAYLEFSRFGIDVRPVYINLIREPLERLVSYYYFVRNGDNFRPHLKRRKAGDTETFDECVEKGASDCDPDNLWMQIPFFCGHAAECWVPGSQWALETAKYNVIHKYLLVGTTESLGDFIALLEATIPRMFRGATQLYDAGLGEKSHMRKTNNKLPASQQTIKKFHESSIWRMEQDFYEFVKDHFRYVKKRTFDSTDGVMVERSQQFSYEKIRPR